MKKFDLLIIGSLIVYALLALFFGIQLSSSASKKQAAHYVEINRIMNAMTTQEDVARFDPKKHTYIQKLQFLDAQEKEETRLQAFYQGDAMSFVIQPWYLDHKLEGYLKFYYQYSDTGIQATFLLVQGGLLVMEISLLTVLWYLRKHLVRPFSQLLAMPMQLADGHYKKEWKLEKSRYFREFLFGMSRLQDELNSAKQRQLKLMKEKKQLLLSLSHDIKTPLNLIRLYAKALDEDLFEDQNSRRNASSKIIEKAKDIEHYVDEIIRSSKEEVIEQTVIQGEFYLKDLITRVLDVYQEQCSYRNIDLRVSPYENRILKGDIARAQEVMENLFENAFKYGDGTRIEVSFYEEDYCQLIRIFNTGTPVSDNEFHHLFDSFFRGMNAAGKAGSGLGLAICKELMQKMEGAVFAQKEKDGMAFVLVFR